MPTHPTRAYVSRTQQHPNNTNNTLIRLLASKAAQALFLLRTLTAANVNRLVLRLAEPTRKALRELVSVTWRGGAGEEEGEGLEEVGVTGSEGGMEGGRGGGMLRMQDETEGAGVAQHRANCILIPFPALP